MKSGGSWTSASREGKEQRSQMKPGLFHTCAKRAHGSYVSLGDQDKAMFMAEIHGNKLSGDRGARAESQSLYPRVTGYSGLG